MMKVISGLIGVSVGLYERDHRITEKNPLDRRQGGREKERGDKVLGPSARKK